MRDVLAALLVSVLLVVPLASAAEAEGSFTVTGGVTTSPGVALEGRPLALLAGDTAEATSFELTASQLKVEKFVRRLQAVEGVGTLGGFVERSSWTSVDASIRLLPGGEHDGIMGFYPGAGPQMRVDPSTEATSERRALSRISNVEGQTSDDFGNYDETVRGAHIYTATSGSLTLTGDGRLKVAGLDIEIQSSNTTRHETGTHRRSITEVTETWLILTLPADATTMLQGAQAVQLAMPAAAVSGEGSARFAGLVGELRKSDGAYAVNGEATIEGAFSGTLVPLADGGARFDLLGGDVRQSSSFVRQPSASPFMGDTPAWWGVAFLLGAVVVAGGAGVVLQRRRGRVRPTPRSAAKEAALPALRQPPPLSPEEVDELARRVDVPAVLIAARSLASDPSAEAVNRFIMAANVCEAKERWDDAYELIRAARRGAPGNGELGIREGMYLLFMGEPRKAYAAFAEAGETKEQRAQAQVWAAICMARLGLYESAEKHIRDALTTDPRFLEAVEAESDFFPMWERPGFMVALALAREMRGPPVKDP